MMTGIFILISTLNFGPVPAAQGLVGPGTPTMVIAAAPQEKPSSAQAETGQKEAEAEKQEDKPTPRRIETWGDFDPGEGFLLGRNKAGELSISAYALVRYINQMPPSQTFTDHLGNERPVDARGILGDMADRVFNPFFTTKPQGSGLGLAIVRKIIDAHDGRIDLRSSAGQGTTFTVSLPVGVPGQLGF